ncbi:hypothetical protein [uncultured Thiodictyon sp.]|jgi:hypothetical protein|uniref:hypothetical protein n=1 Tax=uncultured Thiodictyon sp. TaxID=1846217 RepID=UPI0025D0ACD4|nr:hypothetical protein [uncultured Thiodictyon sp.]
MKTLAALMALLMSAAAGAGPDTNILQNQARYSPFAYILDYLTRNPGQPECYIDEGYLNFTQDWYLDPGIRPTPESGTANLARWPYPIGSEPGSPDITRTLLTGIAAIPGAAEHTHIAVASQNCDGCRDTHPYLKETIPGADLHTDIPADATHIKTLQCTNGRVYLTQHGSTNMQTVGVTTKANNSLVFVETGRPGRPPPLYGWFKDLWQAVVTDTGTVFQGGGRDSSGLGGMTSPVVIGGRQVSFYAGRKNAFVGPTWSDGGLSLPFPGNLYPPTEGQLPAAGLKNVNWYDQILFDAGTRLAKGEHVAIDLFMFEIGASNPFIDNLFRLVKYGFVDCPAPGCPSYANRKPVAISKQPGARPPANAFPGHLSVKLYYQFQQACPHAGPCPTRSYAYLNGPIASGNPRYRMTVKKVWQGFTRSHLPGNPQVPDTPQDMHLKVGVVTSGRQVRLYVATSNLDMPDQGSGKKWQAGTIIDTTPYDGLYRLYQREFASIASDGDLSQYHLGYANTNGNSHLDAGIEPTTGAITQSGIAAFLFPLNTAKAR